MAPSGWSENNMATSRFICIGFSLLLVLLTQQTSALSCGWPGKPVSGSVLSPVLPQPLLQEVPSFGRAYVPTNRVLSYDYQFQEGQTVSYKCQTSRLDVLTGNNFNRTCQGDGRWSGTRPWCDVNVAYGKTVNYAALDMSSRLVEMSDILMTDSLVDSEDPMNAAECPALAKGGGAYLTVNLGENYPVRVVGIFGKKGEGMSNLVNKKVTLGTTECPQLMGNASAFGYQCNRAMSQASTVNREGSTVRFEHGSNFVIDICEVVIYSNPTLADCGEPEIPAFGEVTITTSSLYQEAKYNCRNGYELRGSDVRTCYGRDWGGDQPICVEVIMSSTTEMNYNSTQTFPGGEGGGLDPFQIVLIVVCVALAIGLIVALVVLLYYGRLNCCGTCCESRKGLSCCGTAGNKFSKKLSKKKKKPLGNDQRDYQKVTTPSSTAAASKAMQEANRKAVADQERRAEEEDFINTRLAYQNEKTNQQMQRKPLPTPESPKTPTAQPLKETVAYVELSYEPTRRMESPAAVHSQGDSNSQAKPIVEPQYAQVTMRPGSRNSGKKKEDNNDGTSSDSTDHSTTSPPTRKSYIPSIYLKESPEVQMKQQALNNQLKEAVRISRNTDF